ncbi:MAG TPA: AI-2E family transporter [Gammaproteobacteria bacterium]|nr:AI-2E family transporter [Gammaproteobacteria bacterium]
MQDLMALSPFARKVLVAIGLGILAFVIIYFLNVVSYGLLVLFAGALFAVLLHGLARLLFLNTPVPPGWAFGIIVVGLALLVALAGSVGGMRVAQQAPKLSRQVSKSLNQLHSQLRRSELGRKALESVQSGGSGSQAPKSPSSTSETLSFGATIVQHVRGLVAITIGAITDIFIVLIVGIYLGSAPDYYIRSALRLVPIRKRKRFHELFETLGHALRRWLLGRFLSMIFTGILTTVGLSFLNVPLAVLLGMIAAALTFIPYLGAIISAVPAILIGLLQGPTTALYVGLLYLTAHALEGYVISPLIQRRVVHLAPAFLIGVQLLGGLMAGIIGIILAAPLAVTITIIVQVLYIEDILNDTPHVLGEG